MGWRILPDILRVSICPRFPSFSDLKSLHNFHLINNESAVTNPETQEYWGNPESSDNINDALLTLGQPLDLSKVDSLIAFLKILTDKRYEHLLETK